MGIPAASTDVQPALINDFAVGGEQRPIDNSMTSDRLYTTLGIDRDHPVDVCRKFHIQAAASMPASIGGAAGAGA